MNRLKLPPPPTRDQVLAAAKRIGEKCDASDARDVVDRVRQNLASLRTNVDAVAEVYHVQTDVLMEMIGAIAEVEAIAAALGCQISSPSGVEGSSLDL